MKVETAPGYFEKTQDRNYEQEEIWHRQMLDSGFKYNDEFDFYYSEDGALIGDTIVSIESLSEYPGYAECIEFGYEFSYGKPTPFGLNCGNTRAIYCKNYQEIVNKYRITEQTGIDVGSSKLR